MVAAELYSGSVYFIKRYATRITRSYHTNTLFLPKANCFKCLLQYADPNIWNNFPDGLRNNCSLNVLKDTLTLFLINAAPYDDINFRF